MGLEFFTSLDMLGKIFWLCAIGGTVFFLMRLVLLFVGGDAGEGDFDFDASEAAFDLLSLNTITAFVMMFGWSGLTSYIQFGLGNIQSIIISFLIGALAMLITAFMFQQAKKLVSTGSQFKVDQTVGLNATVYQRIPAEGKGKVNVTIPGGMFHEIDATSLDKVQLESQTIVKIISIIDSSTVSVQKI